MKSLNARVNTVRQPRPVPTHALSFFVGLALNTPSLSLANIGRTGIQPLIPLSIMLIASSLIKGRFRIPLSLWLWLSIFFLSNLIALSGPQRSDNAPIYFLVTGLLTIYALSIFCAYCIDVGRSLMRGYIVGCVLSCVVGFIQVAYGSMFNTTLITMNNPSYFFAQSPYRASGFCPEPSMLMEQIIPAVMIMIQPELRNALFGKTRTAFTIMVILALGSASTLSSSLVWFAPLVLVCLLVMVFNKQLRFKTFIVIVGFLAASVTLYAIGYSGRVARYETTGSNDIRRAKIEAAINVGLKHPLVGAGLGSASEVDTIQPALPSWFGSSFASHQAQSGVDSWAARAFMEQGVLGLLLLAIPFMLCLTGILSRSSILRAISWVSIPTMIPFFISNGYRDAPLGMMAILLPFLARTSIRPMSISPPKKFLLAKRRFPGVAQ